MMEEMLSRGAQAPTLPRRLMLLVWLGAIVLPWALLFWLAALLGCLAA